MPTWCKWVLGILGVWMVVQLFAVIILALTGLLESISESRPRRHAA